MTELGHDTLLHLRLVLVALAAGSVLGVPLGIWAVRRPRAERIALAAASLVQTIPGLALLAVMVPLLAWTAHETGLGLPSIGDLPALLALTLYAWLPILRGVLLGIRGIDPAVIAAARAVGMTDAQRIRDVELPLAMPSIVAGLRTAAVWTVGMATLATPVGGTSLGNPIFAGLQTRHYDEVLAACAAAALLALGLDALLGIVERRAREAPRTRAAPIVLAGLALAAALAAATWAGGLGGAGAPIRVGAKSFTEQLVLAEILRCSLAPAPAEVRPSLGSAVAFDALARGELDVYVEYTGTAWTTLLRQHDAPPRDTMRRRVAALLLRDHHVHVVASLGFENAYALVVPAAATARRISDLDAASQSTVGGDYEFFSRPEWASLRRVYGLAPRETRAMDPSLMYQAVASGAVDVIAGYTTDGRIDALGLHVLDDDRGAIPPYDAIVLVSDRFFRAHPDAIARLRRLDGTIDAATMRRLNAAVDRDGLSPRAAAERTGRCR